MAGYCILHPPSSHLVLQKLPSCATKAEEITSSIGQAFEMAYQHFLETQKAQEDFEQLKKKVCRAFVQANRLFYFQSFTTDALSSIQLLLGVDGEEFAQQLADIQKNVSEMEREAMSRSAPQASHGCE